MVSALGRVLGFLRYGKQIGKVHADGSILRKGNGFFGKAGTKYLVGKDGNVKKYISRRRVSRYCHETTHATPLKNDWRHRADVSKTVYSYGNDSRFIQEHKFIGHYSNGENGTAVGWFLSPGEQVTTNTVRLG